MAIDLGSEQTEPFSRNGDSRWRPKRPKIVPPKRGVGHFAGLQRCALSHSHKSEAQEIPKISHQQSNLPVHLSSLWFGNGPVGIYQGGQRGKADGSSQGYQDPPVLVVESPVLGNWPTTYPDPVGPVLRVGLGGKHEEIGAAPSVGFQFRRLPVLPLDWSGLAHSRKVVDPPTEVTVDQEQEQLHSQPIHVSDRLAHCHRETSLVRSPSLEAHTVAPEATLACAREFGKCHSVVPLSTPISRLVAGREQCSSGPTVASPSTRSANASNEGWVAHLGDSTARGVWSSRLHQLSGIKSSFSGPQEF